MRARGCSRNADQIWSKPQHVFRIRREPTDLQLKNETNRMYDITTLIQQIRTLTKTEKEERDVLPLK